MQCDHAQDSLSIRSREHHQASRRFNQLRLELADCLVGQASGGWLQTGDALFGQGRLSFFPGKDSRQRSPAGSGKALIRVRLKELLDLCGGQIPDHDWPEVCNG